MRVRKALLLDDDPLFCRSFRMLSRDLFDLTIVHNSRDALKHIKENDFEVILLDYKLNEKKNGLEVLQEIRHSHPDLPVIIVTEVEDIDLAAKAMRLGASDFTTKSPNVTALRLRLEQHLLELNWKLLCRDKDEQIYGTLIYKSEAMAKVMELVKQMAKSGLPVLIRGESGTGKGLVAREIHRNSARQHKLFVAINCSNLNPNLFESELFGHEKGAFTDAHSSKKGKIELAHNGSLFLDEICAMPWESQAKILTVIEEKRFSRLGSLVEQDVDARIIAATNDDIDNNMKTGRFRQDLYYRIIGFNLFIPPLRDRRDDILPLAQHFLTDIARGLTVTIDSAAARSLLQYHWPGNVRELKNVIERSFSLSKNKEKLTEIYWQHQPSESPYAIMLEELLKLPYDAAKQQLLSTFKDLYFKALLEKYDQNTSAAARAANVNRTTVHRFLKKS